MFRLSDHLNMTIAVDWDIKPQTKQTKMIGRVATVREKVLENEKNSRSGKSQGITFSVREI